MDLVFWDTAATAYLGKSDLFTMKKAFVEVNTSPIPDQQGTMKVEFIPDTEPLESNIEIATTINVDDFYDYYVGQLKTLEFKSLRVEIDTQKKRPRFQKNRGQLAIINIFSVPVQLSNAQRLMQPYNQFQQL